MLSANLTSRGLVRTSGTLVRAEELGIVLVVLSLWAAAIALFINRWGKIRLMEPYHPYIETAEATPTTAVPPPPPAACNTAPRTSLISHQVSLFFFVSSSFVHYIDLKNDEIYRIENKTF